MTLCPLTAGLRLVLSRVEMKERFMDESVEVLCEKQGEAGLITLNRPKALNALTLTMVREMRRALDAWAQRSCGDADRRAGRGREGLLRRRRHPAAHGRPQGRQARAGARLLARGIPAQHRDQALSQAVYLPHRRHRHGRRGRRVPARRLPGRRRALPLRHARGRDRLLPRCRRDLCAAAPAGRDGHVSRAHGRSGEARRCRHAGPCDPFGREREHRPPCARP